MAERVGFEPTVPSRVHRISNPAHSATLTPLQIQRPIPVKVRCPLTISHCTSLSADCLPLFVFPGNLLFKIPLKITEYHPGLFLDAKNRREQLARIFHEYFLKVILTDCTCVLNLWFAVEYQGHSLDQMKYMVCFSDSADFETTHPAGQPIYPHRLLYKSFSILKYRSLPLAAYLLKTSYFAYRAFRNRASRLVKYAG